MEQPHSLLFPWLLFSCLMLLCVGYNPLPQLNSPHRYDGTKQYLQQPSQLQLLSPHTSHEIAQKRLWTPRKSSALHARKQIPVPPSRSQGGGGEYEAGPPPDLPSLLLQNRIVYIGMPLVPSVTELVIGELLCLSYQAPDQEITLYINSPGTNSPDGKPFSFDTEAFAIADTLLFIPCPIRTVCVGQAFGTAAMLLGIGQKGKRFALPNASIMLHQPRSRARGQAVDVAIKAAEIANNRKTTNELLAKACGKDIETIDKDTSRVKYFSPEEAVAYGLIDAVLYPGSEIEKQQRLKKAW